MAIDASGLDHTPVAPGENRVFGEQFGPLRASRAMAIVHIAMFDAANAIAGHYRSYTGWGFDKAEGITQGQRVADYVFEHAFTPVHRPPHDGH